MGINYNYVYTTTFNPPPPPPVCLLCALSELFSSLHRQRKYIDTRNTRYESVEISITIEISQEVPIEHHQYSGLSRPQLFTPIPQKPPTRSPQLELLAPIWQDPTTHNL